MGKLTLSFLNDDNIHVLKIKDYSVLDFELLNFAKLCKHKNSKAVFVLFEKHKTKVDEKEFTRFCVTNQINDILHEVNYLESWKKTDIKKVHFCVFEFDSYKEAFLYCIDLKEGL